MAPPVMHLFVFGTNCYFSLICPFLMILIVFWIAAVFMFVSVWEGGPAMEVRISVCVARLYIRV